MARQEQDSITGGPHSQAGVGGPGYAPAMSPQGSRAGPSPNPADMKRGTPKLGPQGLPGSPMPDGAMQPQRNSPAPNMNFDPSQMPPGIPPQFGVGNYPQMAPGAMMQRPPSSHPGGFNPQQMNPQQMEAMRQNMQNGAAWRGGPGGPQMMPGQAQQMGGPMNNTQQRGNPNPMPPPPAPAPANEQPRAQEPSPSQPAQAPPTPSQGNKPAPKKKNTKDNKVTLSASFSPLSIIDIDCRSPRKRKGQIQVRLQQRQVKILRQRRLLPRRLRPCILNRLDKMASHNLASLPHNLNNLPLRHSNLWTMAMLHSVALVTR